MEGFMKYTVEMGSGVMMYIPSFMKFGSGIQKLIAGNSPIHRENGYICVCMYV
jgi:hypothetical protein